MVERSDGIRVGPLANIKVTDCLTVAVAPS